MNRLVTNRLIQLAVNLALVAGGAAIMLAILKAMAGDWGYVIILVVLSTPALVIMWPYRRVVIQSMKDRGL